MLATGIILVSNTKEKKATRSELVVRDLGSMYDVIGSNPTANNVPNKKKIKNPIKKIFLEVLNK